MKKKSGFVVYPVCFWPFIGFSWKSQDLGHFYMHIMSGIRSFKSFKTRFETNSLDSASNLVISNAWTGYSQISSRVVILRANLRRLFLFTLFWLDSCGGSFISGKVHLTKPCFILTRFCLQCLEKSKIHCIVV